MQKLFPKSRKKSEEFMNKTLVRDENQPNYMKINFPKQVTQHKRDYSMLEYIKRI